MINVIILENLIASEFVDTKYDSISKFGVWNNNQDLNNKAIDTRFSNTMKL